MSTPIADENAYDATMQALAGTKTVTCKCLNVRFDVSMLSQSNNTNVNKYSDAVINSLLHEPLLLNIEFGGLSDCGAQFAIPYLVGDKPVHDWKLYTCLNCKTTTHAESLQNKGIVFVNFKDMLQQAQQELIVSTDPNYCQPFGIVCLPVNDLVVKKSSLKPLVLDLVRGVKDRVTEFLESEKASMKRRIKEFESSQLAMFEDLESTMSSCKDNLENQIWAAYLEENDDVDSALEKSVEEISDTDERNNFRGKIPFDVSSVLCTPIPKL